MEIVAIMIVVLIGLYVVGKMRGDPDPSKMSDTWLVDRQRSEMEWTNKNFTLVLKDPHNEWLSKTYDRRSAYLKQIQSELAKRRMNASVNACADATGKLLRRLAPVVASTMLTNKCDEETAMSMIFDTIRQNKQLHISKGLSEAEAEEAAITALLGVGK